MTEEVAVVKEEGKLQESKQEDIVSRKENWSRVWRSMFLGEFVCPSKRWYVCSTLDSRNISSHKHHIATVISKALSTFYRILGSHKIHASCSLTNAGHATQSW